MESKNHCFRCGHEWTQKSKRLIVSTCSKCKRRDWHKRTVHQNQIIIDSTAPVGGSLIYVPWVMSDQMGGIPDYWANRIKQDTVSRKIKRLGIPFRVSVHGEGVIYTRAA